MLAGPQAERERIWAAKSAELAQLERQDLVRQDLVIEHDIEKQVLETELNRLRRENSSLKENVQRCLKELKAYQLKYPSAYAPIHPLVGDDIPPWISSAEVNSPLFDAYDSRIAELEDLVQHLTVQIENIRGQVESVTAENENLRTSQLETLRQAAINTKREESTGGTFGPLEAELMNELNERAEILMAENTLMVEQKTVLLTELDQYQAELGKSTQEVANLSQQLSGVAKELQMARARALQSEKDREGASAQIIKYSEALGRLESELEDCKEQLAIWEQKGDVADSNMVEARKQLKAMAVKIEEDTYVFVRRTKVAEDRVKELQIQLSQRTQELDVSQEVARKLRREYQSTRQDAEGMLQVMSGLERQLSEFSSREEEVRRVGKEQKERLEEAFIARDQAIAREEQCKREADRLLEERKRLQLGRQKELDDAGEQARMVMVAQMKAVEADLIDCEKRNSILRVETERAVRESRAYKEQLERLQREIEAQRDSSVVAVKELEDKLCSVSISREEESNRLKKTREMNLELRATIDKLRIQADTVHLQTEERDRQRDKELMTVKAALKELQREHEDRLRQLGFQLHTLQEEKASSSAAAVEADRRREEDCNILRRKIVEIEGLLQEIQSNAEVEARRLQGLLQSAQDSAFTAQTAIESRLKEERDTCGKLTKRCRELEESITAAQLERDKLTRTLKAERLRISRLNDEVRAERKRVKELAVRLATSFEAREEAVRAVARSRGDIDTLNAVDKEDTLTRSFRFASASAAYSPDGVERVHLDDVAGAGVLAANGSSTGVGYEHEPVEDLGFGSAGDDGGDESDTHSDSGEDSGNVTDDF